MYGNIPGIGIGISISHQPGIGMAVSVEQYMGLMCEGRGI